MVKLKHPLLSLGAVGRLAKDLTFTRRRRTNIAEKTPIPDDPRSLAQLSWRHMYQKAVALWHALSPADQQDWQSQASRRHMTGFAWFMSQALKPNPGLYLPLQGGTMAGEIDMDGHRIKDLPFPGNNSDPLRYQEYIDHILPYLMTQGARVFHSANQSVSSGITTTLAYNSERYDTDAIHDNVVSNSRLTCKTAGVYLITTGIRWASNPNNQRILRIRLNGTDYIVESRRNANSFAVTDVALTTIYKLQVGHYVETLCAQLSGVPLNVVASPKHSPEFSMQRIGS